ncbi:MAG: S8 family serine peptidase [Motiliproteus sp.]
MMSYQYLCNQQKIVLNVDEDRVAVRFIEPAKYSTRSRVAHQCGLGQFCDRLEVPAEKYTLLPVGQSAEPRNIRQQTAIQNLIKEADIACVTPVFKQGENTVIATDRILLSINSEAGSSSDKLAKILDRYDADLLEESSNEYLIQLPESTDPLATSSQLAQKSYITYAEPDFVTIGSHVARRPLPREQISASDPQSHRQYAIEITRAVDAWRLQQGDPQVRIAILDEGIDTAHEDLAGNIVGSFDGVDNDTFQEPNPWDGHGTACAGLAAAIHNTRGIQGIGGGCSILAIRIAYSPQKGADWVTRNSWITRSIDWAWQNGAHILSNSWGGGAPSSAIVNAFERARTQGRDGKGCVIVVAAGNASSPVDFPGNLPYVLTVSASNEFDEFKTKTSRDGENWWGSNFGPEVDLAAPGVHNLTTDISGEHGYQPGNYTDFNGTSSATPIVAGAAGLLLSENSELSEQEVRNKLKQTADKAGSIPYTNGRNDQFGHGRLNVLSALQVSQPQQAGYTVIHKVLQKVPIKDQQSSRVSVAVGDSKLLKNIKVHVEIKHTYISDLLVTLHPPVNSGEAPVTLHDHTGKGKDDLVRSYDTVDTPGLAQLIGQNLQGEWFLEVSDNANIDEGEIVSLGLELLY